MTDVPQSPEIPTSAEVPTQIEDHDDDAVEAGPAPAPSPEASDSQTPASTTTRARAAAVPRSYPRRTIEDALRIPMAIKDNNGGQPWAPDQVAQAVGMGMSGAYYYLTQSSRDFGFTIGTRDAAQIEITELGKHAVYPGSDEERAAALLEAFLKVEIFKKVVEHYHGSKLPDEPYRTNTLTTTFGLDETIVDEFVGLFEKNTRFVGIGTDWPTTSETSPGHIRPLIAAAGSGPKDEGGVLVGKPSGVDTGLRCFIAMPFSEKSDEYPIGFFSEVFNSLLVPAITAAGFEAFTARRAGSDVIQATIVNDLLDADLVVVDLTEHNPNVLFELGMRMHADLPVALIRAKGTGPIFDVDNMLRVEEYSPNLWASTVKRDVEALRDHIKGAWDNRETSQTFMQILQRRSSN